MDRTVLITGGAGGLGKELVLMLLNKNLSVVVLDRVPYEKLDIAYRNRLKKYIELDLSDLEGINNSIQEYFIKEKIVIDIFIINAFPRIFNKFNDFKDFEIIKFVNLAFTSQLIYTNYFLNKMAEKKYGRIIIIGSKSAIQGYSSGSLYCSLKAAWVTFHESIEKELSASNNDITITTICPDSFSDLCNNKGKHYNYIVSAIGKHVLKAIYNNNSAIYYPTTFLTKMALCLQLLRKLVKLWK
jgi:short-subunit dehydrogenase